MFRFRPITCDNEASDISLPENRISLVESLRNVDLDHEDSGTGASATGGTCTVGTPTDLTSQSDAIRRLLRPVREKHSSKEAEEIRITRLYQHALRISSDSESSLETIPLLESIVHSFLLRSASSIPAHLKTIKFASCTHLAKLYLKSGNPEMALKLLKMAVELDSTDVSIWLKLANTAITLHRFDVATPALTHILKEQPSHPLALHWALPYFFAISEYEACIMYSLRCLFVDSLNQLAIHCLRRVLALQPSLAFLLDNLLKLHPDILSRPVVSEEVKMSTDERIDRIREGYVKMLADFEDVNAIKTVKFPEPLTKLSWEHLADAVVTMFDRLTKENAVNSMLDLGSLFQGCQIPSRQHSQETEAVVSRETAVVDVDSEVSLHPLSSDTNGDSPLHQASQLRVDPLHESTSVQQTPTSRKGEEDERRRISRRIRRSTAIFDDISSQCPCIISGTHTNIPSSLNCHTPIAPGTPAVPISSTPCSGQHPPSTVATDAKLTQKLWTDKAIRFRSLLPSSFRDLASLFEKIGNPQSHANAPISESPSKRESSRDDEGGAKMASEKFSESDLVTQFLQTLAPDNPNVVMLGIALLLQMSSCVKPWTKSFATAYLAVSARFRPCLPLWQPSTLPKAEETCPSAEEGLLPADLLCLRRGPNLWQLANLHFAYAEVRLDAFAVCRKAADAAKRSSDPVASLLHSPSDGPDSNAEFRALSQALHLDSSRFFELEEAISVSDFNELMKVFSLLPAGSPETRVYRGRDRIDELLAEVKDVSVGEQLQHLCKVEPDTTKLIKALNDFLRSHAADLRNSKSTQSYSGGQIEGLLRFCRMLHTPFGTLSKRLSRLYADCRAESSVGEAVSQAQLCWHLATRTLAFLEAGCVNEERLLALNTLPLPEEEASGLMDIWSTVTVVYQLLQTCWEIINGEMFLKRRRTTFMKIPTLDSLSSKVIFAFKQPDKRISSIVVGHFCHTLRLVIDTFAWRLLATGVLSLPAPEISRNFVAFIHETLDSVELCFPIYLLHPKLAVYRALRDLDKANVNTKMERSLLVFLRDHPISRVLGCARGRGIAPPSLLLLHLFHDLLPLITPYPHCCSSPSAPLGLRYLRGVALRVARILNSLSEGYRRMQSSRDVGRKVLPGVRPTKEVAEAVAGDANHAWPNGGVRLGEILAQVMHCLCGLPARSCVSSTVITVSDSSKVSSLTSSSPSLNSSRFKQPVPPPQWERRPQDDDEWDEAEVIEFPRFKALTPTTSEMPPSCVAPRPPLWLADCLFFHEAVENHTKDLSGPPNGGVWWPDDRHSKLDWQLIEIAFAFYRPPVIPEYDSIKSLSISSELANWLTAALKLMPKAYEEFMIPEERINACMTVRAPLPKQTHYLSDMLNLAYYLLADYYTKNNNFDLAINYYERDLRISPHHADSWAALALIYSSRLEQILNVIDPKTERVTSRAVASCLRCFELALELHPSLTTLLTERGCLAYQLHSYAARLVKKSSSRSFQEAHLRVCMQWRRRMLILAYRSYGRALRWERKRSASSESVQLQTQSPSTDAEEVAPTESSPISISSSPSVVGEGANSSAPSAVDEEWLYHYMLTKCEEKAGPGALFRDTTPKAKQLRESHSDWVLRVLSNYQHTADVLRAAGAKYPKRIIVYNKLPYLAVESIEVFYRTHAFVLKVLLHAGEPLPSSPSPLPLRQICEVLYSLTQSAFVTEPGKSSGKIRSRKRSSLVLESSTKVPRLEGVNNSAAGAVDIPAEVGGTSSPQSDVETGEIVSRPSFALLSDLEALELVLRRLPLHYKAMYRLAHLYLNLPSLRDLDKAMAILMGPFDHVSKVEYGGLFKDRRQTNFFHGVWRIPTADIDRSGSFAAHMYRSTLMVLEVLNKRGDWTRMLQVFHQLRKQPPEDKRGFLSEGDRVFLARRAFSLIHPCLQLWLARQRERSLQRQEETGEWDGVSLDTLRQIYRLHSFAQSRAVAAAAAAACAPQNPPPPSMGSPEAEEERTEEAHATDVAPCFSELLEQAYELCPAAWDLAGPKAPRSLILKRCSELAGTASVFATSPMKPSTSASRVSDPILAQQTTS